MIRRIAPVLLLSSCHGAAPATGDATGSSSGTDAIASTSSTGASASTGALESSSGDVGSSGGSSDGADTVGESSSSTGGEAMACTLSGQAGLCEDVVGCAGLSLLGVCDGVPSLQCCLPDAVSCSVLGAPGLCLPTAQCPRGLEQTAGLCPGDADIQCCTDPALACDESAMPLPNEGLVEVVLDPSCPPGMIAIDSFCIDRFEAALVVIDDGGAVVSSHSPYFPPGDTLVRAVSIEGAVPQGYIDADSAQAACAAAGKRLCSDTEWLRACRGEAATIYPWGDRAMPGVCNDARAQHPAVEYFGTAEPWIWSELGNPCILQVPDGVQTTGAHPGCVTAEGAFDMVGNLHEWTADPAGTFRGGFFVDTVLNGPGCTYATVAHDRSHWDYSTGFRCCADP
ncbi:MAG: formylglycine-generating enzyme family protein [Nannocystaceae bacterium]|nr:formylglycine-generating enzyme family protein [Nannocystaceae bacterium]